MAQDTPAPTTGGGGTGANFPLSHAATAAASHVKCMSSAICCTCCSVINISYCGDLW